MIYCPDCDVPCTSEHLPGCRQGPVVYVTPDEMREIAAINAAPPRVIPALREASARREEMPLTARCCDPDGFAVLLDPDGRCSLCGKRCRGPYFGGTAEERERAGRGRAVLDGVGAKLKDGE